MKIICPFNSAIWIDHPSLDAVETVKVQAVLVKYWQDGGTAPASFTVHDSWNGRRGITIASTIDGHTWALQIPPTPSARLP